MAGQGRHPVPPLCADNAWLSAAAAAAGGAVAVAEVAPRPDEGATPPVGLVAPLCEGPLCEGPLCKGAVTDDGGVGARVLLRVYYPNARQNHQLLRQKVLLSLRILLWMDILLPQGG